MAGGLLAVGCGVAATAVAPLVSAVAISLVGVLAGAAAVVDVHERRLPNRLLSLSLLVVAVAAVLDGAWTTVDVAISLCMAALPLWVVRYGKGLALGDVKFAAVLGAATGLVHPFAGVLVVWVAALAGGVFALRTGRRRLAFGPWLWAGYLTAGLAAVAFVQVVLEMSGHSWPARP
jgi:prepilin signal peptidase PulO-like enzyme (type II secretory pathway)